MHTRSDAHDLLASQLGGLFTLRQLGFFRYYAYECERGELARCGRKSIVMSCVQLPSHAHQAISLCCNPRVTSTATPVHLRAYCPPLHWCWRRCHTTRGTSSPSRTTWTARKQAPPDRFHSRAVDTKAGAVRKRNVRQAREQKLLVMAVTCVAAQGRKSILKKKKTSMYSGPLPISSHPRRLACTTSRSSHRGRVVPGGA